MSQNLPKIKKVDEEVENKDDSPERDLWRRETHPFLFGTEPILPLTGERIHTVYIEAAKEETKIVPFQFLKSESLKLKEPLYLNLTYYPNEEIYIAEHFQLNIYGSGRDEEAAMNDFTKTLEEFYFNLKKDKDKLGSDLEKKWKILNSIIEE